MATAPNPKRRKRVGIRLTMKGETRTLMMADMGAPDDLASRKATGLVPSNFINQESFGADSLALIWWLAGRKIGIKPSFEKVLTEFPNMEDLAEMLDDGSLKLESIDDESEDDEHPLPEGADSSAPSPS